MTLKTIEELNKLSTDGESADKELFQEMRNNVKIHSSDHWSKVAENLRDGLRSSKVNDSIKMKLTKNHSQIVTKTYINGILSQNPGVHVDPFNSADIQDKKDSELSNAVWSDGEDKQDIDEKTENWALSFVVIGECAAFVRFNPVAGKLKGYRQKVSEEGMPLHMDASGKEVPMPTDEMGQPLEPVKDEENPVFEGELQIEDVYAFNIIRAAGAETMKQSPFLCLKKMVAIADAKAFVNSLDIPDDQKKERLGFVNTSSETTFKVFHSTSGEFSDSKDQVLFKEYYFRPCSAYPEGYFYITTPDGILHHDVLPFGIYPLIIEGFDAIPTSPRCRSIIKAIRAPQAEINRLASARAYHSIVMGSDKIITQLGSRLQKGSSWEGIREYTVNGLPPTIIPGRSGDQFAANLESEVKELYRLANLEYEMQERQIQDPHAMLYTNLSQRKKYVIYAKKFERFQCAVAKTYLQMAKRYFSDERLIKAVGKREAINIAEFRRIDDDGFNIKCKPISNDIESMMGKNLNIQTILQYAGKDLPKHIQGMVMKQMPFVNADESLKYMTTDLDKIESDILALDRGEQRPSEPEDDHDLYLQLLTNRKKLGDYRLLPDQIKQGYEAKIQDHRDAASKAAQELKAAEAEYLPMDGPLVKVDMYGPEGKRMVVPLRALEKFMELLDKQGVAQERLQQLDQYNHAKILDPSIGQNGPPQPGMPPGMPPQGPPMPPPQGMMQHLSPNQQQGPGPAVGMQRPPPRPF